MLLLGAVYNPSLLRSKKSPEGRPHLNPGCVRYYTEDTKKIFSDDISNTDLTSCSRYFEVWFSMCRGWDSMITLNNVATSKCTSTGNTQRNTSINRPLCPFEAVCHSRPESWTSERSRKTNRWSTTGKEHTKKKKNRKNELTRELVTSCPWAHRPPSHFTKTEDLRQVGGSRLLMILMTLGAEPHEPGLNY